MRRILGLALAAALVLATLLALTASQAFANHVHCGDTITEDTTLDSNLNCPGDGLTVGASNVTLDLNGHAITDLEPSYDRTARGVVVVSANASHPLTGIRITGGTIQGFRWALYARSAEVSVSDMTFSDNNEGIIAFDASIPVFEHNIGGGGTIFGARSGPLAAGPPFEIRNNIGVGFQISDHSASIHDNDGTLFLLTGASFAVAHNRISYGLVGTNDCKDLSVTDNEIFGARWGIADRCEHSRLIHNTIIGTEGDGISVGSPAPSTQVIEHNVVKANTGIGIKVAPTVSLLDNLWPSATVAHNIVIDNKREGILIATSPASPSLVQGNTVDRNGFFDGVNHYDGILVGTSNVTLTANRTFFNANHGILASPGDTDGGKNRAKGNGNPPQCVNVSCSTTGKPNK